MLVEWKDSWHNFKLHRAPVALVLNFVNVPVSDNYEMSPFPILLPWDCDDSDSEEEHQQAQLLVGLLECWQQTLKSSEVSHKLNIIKYNITFISVMDKVKSNHKPL